MAKRSYFDEVNELSLTWQNTVDNDYVSTSNLTRAFFSGTAVSIGSGGSFVLAKMWQMIYEEYNFGFAKAMTPFEFNLLDTFPEVVFLFTASGKNHDILHVFKKAILRGCRVIVFTTTPKSPLIRLVKTHFDQAIAIYPKIKSPRDGFLAVNSTIAISGIIVSLLKDLTGDEINTISPIEKALKDHEDGAFCNTTIKTVQIISSEWGMPAGHDMEIRLAESGVAPCFHTDPRNFGHGRFIWLSKHAEETLVVIMCTTKSAAYIKKYLKLLPVQPILIKAEYEGVWGAIYCIVRSIFLFKELAMVKEIDPGKPNVPDWGKKIHSLRVTDREISKDQDYLKYNKIYPAKFKGLVLDVDGTLVDTDKRFEPVIESIQDEIRKLVNEGLVFGFSTGRGKSAIELIRDIVPEHHWKNIIMGLYNGTLVLNASETVDFNKIDKLWPTQIMVTKFLQGYLVDFNVDLTIRPTQISLNKSKLFDPDHLITKLKQSLGQNFRFVKVMHSEHSIDFLPSWATKLCVVEKILTMVDNENVLCIGDQAQIGGNDEDLLSWIPSISVGALQPASNACLWLGKSKDSRGTLGTLQVLRSIEKQTDSFTLNHTKLT